MCHQKSFSLMMICAVSMSFFLAGCAAVTAAPTPHAEDVVDMATVIASRAPATFVAVDKGVGWVRPFTHSLRSAMIGDGRVRPWR